MKERQELTSEEEKEPLDDYLRRDLLKNMVILL